MEAKKDDLSNALCLELKYCERCGGLWLRPIGTGQMFCVRCAGEMSEPPARPRNLSYPKLPEERRRLLDDDSIEACAVDAGLNGESTGGLV